MTFTISKTKLAIAVVAVALAIPTSAMAFHVFDDVPDERFFAESVEWAFDNGITTGKTSTTFAPDDGVTRGESVTFLKRYDDNVIQPAIAELEAAIGDLQADVAPLTNSVAAFSGGDSNQAVDGEVTVQSVSLMPPADGTVIVNSQAYAYATGAAATVRCVITTDTVIDFDFLQINDVDTAGDFEVISGTRGFDATEGALLTVNLVCDTSAGAADIRDAAMTAVYAPT